MDLLFIVSNAFKILERCRQPGATLRIDYGKDSFTRIKKRNIHLPGLIMKICPVSSTAAIRPTYSN